MIKVREFVSEIITAARAFWWLIHRPRDYDVYAGDDVPREVLEGEDWAPLSQMPREEN